MSRDNFATSSGTSAQGTHTDFACRKLHETIPQFKVRVKKVEKFMNSKKFKAKKDGGGLMNLANDLRSRCEDLKKRQGERIPK